MYQIRRKHTKSVVEFGQANMLGMTIMVIKISKIPQCWRCINIQG